MASDFPRSPRFLKGALVAYDSPVLGPIPNIIVFQYNPDQLTRGFRARTAPADPRSAGQARNDALQTLAPPVETINLSVEIDATDQLESKNPIAIIRGIQPTLSALELLMFPKSTQIILSATLAMAGTSRVQSSSTPLVLFVWGLARVLPVRVTSFNVTEQSFDTALNPIRAKVDLGLTVMTYLDVPPGSIGSTAYVAMMVQREVLAALNLINSAQNFLGGLIPL